MLVQLTLCVSDFVWMTLCILCKRLFVGGSVWMTHGERFCMDESVPTILCELIRDYYSVSMNLCRCLSVDTDMRKAANSTNLMDVNLKIATFHEN